MPSRPQRRIALALLALLLPGPEVSALILYGTGPGDGNNALNVIDPALPATLPASGAPVANLVQFGVGNASGVYLGHGYVLTAGHVNDPTSVLIYGISYPRDLAFAPLHVTADVPGTAYVDSVDLKLVKITGRPPLPVVQKLPLNQSLTDDLSKAGTMTGWGEGKGGFLTAPDGTTNANKGWLWGGGGTRAYRWGTNTTLPTPATATYATAINGVGIQCQYEALRTDFNRTLGGTTGQFTVGDSGGGFFQQLGGVWKLSGINTTVLRYQDFAATYDNNPPYFASPQNDPFSADASDASDYVRLARYAHLLRYENWAATKLGNAAAGLTADPDKDGIGNLLEYAFSTDPNAPSSASAPVAGMENGSLTLTYTQLLSATDLTYTVEETPSLSPATWTTATVSEETVSTNGVTRVVKAKVAPGAAGRKYLRLSVTRLE